MIRSIEFVDGGGNVVRIEKNLDSHNYIDEVRISMGDRICILTADDVEELVKYIEDR